MKRKVSQENLHIDEDRVRKITKMLNRAVHQEDPSRELIPGLPDHLATLCLARVSTVSSLWGVCGAWHSLIYSNCFRRCRKEFGLEEFKWLYVMLAHQGESAQDPSRTSFSWYALDPLSSLWHKLPQMPGDVRFEVSRPRFLGTYSHSIQCTSTSDKLILIAGTRRPSESAPPDSTKSPLESALDAPLVFDVATATWSRGPRYTVARRWCTCGTARGKVLIASGCGNGWDVDTARSAEVWDTATSPATWRAVPRLASTKLSREATSAVDVAGRLHMASARSGAVFDPETETWQPMPHGMTRGWNGPCVASRGRLMVVDDTAGRLRAYDDRTDQWVTLVEDERLKMAANVVGWNGKICCSVDGLIRVVEMNGDQVRFREINPPVQGQIVSMQLLSSMVLS